MNFGRGGTTACETNVPFDRTRQFRSAKSFKPHLVILMLGTNDAKDTNWGVRCNETSLAARLASISSAMRVHKSLPPPPTLLLEPPAIYKEKWRLRKSNLVEVRKAVRKYVHGNNATRPCTASSTWLARPLAIDERAHPWRYFMDDGVHLNEKGSRLLACSAFAGAAGILHWQGCWRGARVHLPRLQPRGRSRRAALYDPRRVRVSEEL